VTEDLWGAARAALKRIPANPPGVNGLTRRARTLRARRYAVAGLALLVAGAGVFFPLRLLSRLGEPPENGRIGPGASSNTPAIHEEQRSYRPDWFAHVDTGDRVRIEAPRDWVYRKDPTVSGAQPKILFVLGSWNVPAHWESAACGYDSVLSFLPEDGVLIWLEEVRSSASASKDLLESPIRLNDLVPGQSACVPQQSVGRLEFRFDGRNFLISVAFGKLSTDSLRATVDEVLSSFRTRIEEEPFPPEPTGPVIEVATGTAFGGTWTLSAYRTKLQGESVVCYQILGSGSGCADPKLVAPEAGSYFQSVNYSGTSGLGIPSETFAYGVVWKGVAGITLTLDDGRVLSSETLRSKAFPLAFYVIPFEGRSEQVVSIEALDAKGNVLEENTFGM
jgi:hypothetical protein